MVEDRYRLAPVRDARERSEVVRRGELATAIDNAGDTERRLSRARAETEAARANLAQATASREATASAANLALAERYIQRRRHELERRRDEELRAVAAHDAQTEAVDLSRAKLVRARADREVIERHFAEWRRSQRALAVRRED